MPSLFSRFFPNLTSGLLLLLLVVAGGHFLFFLAQAAVRPSSGFVTYYTSARLVREGHKVALFYDRAWFQAQIEQHTPGVRDIYHANLPTMSLMLLPLSALDYRAARIAWTGVNLLIFLVAGGWLLAQAGFREEWGLGMGLLALLYQPLYANLYDGQAYVLLFGLLVLAWEGYRREVASWLGLALALMLLLKSAGLMLWPLLLVQRQGKALGWALLLTVGAACLSLPRLGQEAWRRYGELVVAVPRAPEMAVTAYQSHLSLFRHLFDYDARWNPAPLADLPILANALAPLTLLLLLGLTLWRAWGHPPSELTFAAVVLLNVMLSPVSLDYHYTLLLLPIALLVAWARQRATLRVWLLLLLGIALIAADLPYRSPRLGVGAWALLAYPKLYGAALLWWLWMRATRTPAPTIPATPDKATGKVVGHLAQTGANSEKNVRQIAIQL